MKPELIFKDYLLNSPVRYQTIGQVLFNLFLVIGNGHEWNADGELTSDRWTGSASAAAKAVIRQSAARNYQPSLATVRFRLNYAFTRTNIERVVLIKNWTLDLSHALMTSQNLLEYTTTSRFNLLNTMPENVSPEWKFAALWFLSELRSEIHLGLDSRRKIYGKVFEELGKKLAELSSAY